MAWALANNKTNTASLVSTLAAPAFTNALTNPSICIVAVLYTNTTTVQSITDTAGNTYVDCGASPVLFATSADAIQLFYCLNTHTTASNIVTVTLNASATHLRIIASEFKGSTASSPIDVTQTIANQTSVSTGANVLVITSKATNVNGDLIIGVFGTVNANTTVGTSPNAFTSIGSSGGLMMEYFVQTSAGSIGPTASDASTDSWGGIMAAFLIASGGTFTKSVTDTVTVTDSINVAIQTVVTEVITLVDTINRAITLGKSEVITLVDVIKRAITVGKSEVYTLTDSLVRLLGIRFTETLTLLDGLGRSITVKWAEVIHIVETFKNGAPLALVFSEVLNLLDSILPYRYLEAALRYFRNYVLDLSGTPDFAAAPAPGEPTVTVDSNIGYWREYLGKQ